MRWLLTMSSSLYGIIYRQGKLHSKADAALSRLPLTTPEGVFEEWPIDVLFFNEEIQFPISAATITRETRRDIVLSKVTQLVQMGTDLFPDSDSYKSKHLDLSTHDGCLFLGARVITPTKLQLTVFDLLHGCHLGASLTKARARSHVW